MLCTLQENTTDPDRLVKVLVVSTTALKNWPTPIYLPVLVPSFDAAMKLPATFAEVRQAGQNAIQGVVPSSIRDNIITSPSVFYIHRLSGR